MLDWTTNPFVALFFAREETNKDGVGDPAAGEVFVLNKPKPVEVEEIQGENWQKLAASNFIILVFASSSLVVAQSDSTIVDSEGDSVACGARTG